MWIAGAEVSSGGEGQSPKRAVLGDTTIAPHLEIVAPEPNAALVFDLAAHDSR